MPEGSAERDPVLSPVTAPIYGSEEEIAFIREGYGNQTPEEFMQQNTGKTLGDDLKRELEGPSDQT